MKRCQKIKFTVLLTLLFATQVVAQHDEPLFNFKFQHKSNFINNNQPTKTNDNVFLKQVFSQYDVTLAYPWNSQHLNLDLGLTFRHLTASSTNGAATDHYYQSMPLLHASALLNTPLKGFSAGIAGNHFSFNKSQVFDYRAQLSYEWRKGFGMQGGWQHQQLGLDKVLDFNSDTYRKGPFLDFYLNF